MAKHDTKVTLDTIKSDINKSDSAIREAIANAIDADSKNIYINLYSEEIKSTVTINYFSLDIADDGDGIPKDNVDFEKAFCRYKDSPKTEKSNYGKRGKGRYTYLVLTNKPENISIYSKDSNTFFKINFDCKDNENIKINRDVFDDKVDTPIKKVYTTLIQFKNLDMNNFEIKNKNDKDEVLEDIKNEIITFFADRIASKSINIYLNNELLNINAYLEKDIISKEIEESKIKFSVDFYIWNNKIKLKSDRQKHILFFDEDNRLRGILPSGKNKLAFSGKSRDHSMIVKSKYFNNKDFSNNSDSYNNLFTDEIIKNLKNKISMELEVILKKIYFENIDKLSDEYIYFLKSSQDEITQNVYHSLFLPFVSKFGGKKIAPEIKSVIANLVNVLVSEAPDSFINNLGTILNLTKEDSEKLDYVQTNYGIIKAITEKEKVIKRIDFLNTFDNLVNSKDNKNVKERTQLHQVIETNLWLIDEKFEDIKISDIISDQSLKSILEKDDFFQFDSDKLKDIALEHNINKIPDIYIPIQKDNIIYIIELKKPTVKINQNIISEVMNKYVKTLKEINQQYQINDRKRIWGIAISDSKTEGVYPIGDINNNGIYIEPKCWSELIESARERYNQKIESLNNKLKNSHWKDIDDFILSHGGRI